MSNTVLYMSMPLDGLSPGRATASTRPSVSAGSACSIGLDRRHDPGPSGQVMTELNSTRNLARLAAVKRTYTPTRSFTSHKPSDPRLEVHMSRIVLRRWRLTCDK